MVSGPIDWRVSLIIALFLLSAALRWAGSFAHLLLDVFGHVRSRPRTERAAIVIAVTVLILFGGSKKGQDGDFSGRGNPFSGDEPMQDANGGMGGLRTGNALTEGAGFALTGSETGAVWDFSPPAGVPLYGLWRLRGAVEDFFRLPLDAYPYFVFSDGRIQNALRDPSRVYTPFRATLGVVPEANWGMLPTGCGQSGVWWDVTVSNSLRVTWLNLLFNRSPGQPVSFQVEIFPDGGAVYRYDLSSLGTGVVTGAVAGISADGNWTVPDVFDTGTAALIWRYFPAFDRDGDGLADSVDPDPFTAGLDAHGTNVEWLNAVCSNILTASENGAGTQISFRDGVNTNAYCFAELAVVRGPALVSFQGEGVSDLADPVVVALAGVTNRVPLLVGKRYNVFSTEPLLLCAGENPGVVSTWNGDASVELLRDIDVSVFSEDTGGGTGAVCTVTPDPIWLSSCVSIFAGCCGTVTGTFTYTPGICAECGCEGCRASFTFTYEGFSRTLFSPFPCVCGSGGFPQSGPDGIGPYIPGVSISTDHSAVIFEPCYTNQANDVVQRHSTSLTVTCNCSAGESDGAFSFSIPNGASRVLVRRGGPDGMPVSGTYTDLVPAGTARTYTFDVEGIAASNEEGDVTFRAEQTFDGGRVAKQISVTSIRVTVEPLVLFPAEYPNRHIFGCCEEARFKAIPVLSGFCWTNFVYTGFVSNNSSQPFNMPLEATRFTMFASYLEVVLPLNIEVIMPTRYVVPQGIFNDNIQFFTIGEPVQGQSGNFGFEIPLVLCPTNVSFAQLYVCEGVSSNGVHTGYFRAETNLWEHTEEMGAWADAVHILNDNSANVDTVMIGALLPPYRPIPDETNYLKWCIPNYFTDGARTSTNFFCDVSQEFSLSDHGSVIIRKFGIAGVCHTNRVMGIIWE